MFALLIVVIGIAAVEQYDSRLAWILAVLIVLALFTKNPRAIQEFGRLVSQGTTSQDRR